MNSIQPHRSHAAPADRAPAPPARGRRRSAIVLLALLAPVVVGASLAPALQSSHPLVAVKTGATRSSNGGGGTLLTGCDTSRVLFGPKTYVRSNGTPVTVIDTFPLGGANGPFHLVLVNGLPDGTGRGTGGTVRVNGTLVITSGDLGNSVDSLSRSISLQSSNTIEVRITGTPGGQFSLRVTGSLTVLPTIALVAPPESLLTGADSVTVHGAATGGPSLAVTVNGLNAPRGADDSFTVRVPLPDEGWNTITAIADDGCQSVTAVRQVKRDTQAPTLAVTAPIDGAATTSDSVTVNGTASDASSFTVTVNGDAAAVDGTGAFSRRVALALGSNTITVVATDVLGHSSTESRGVTRNPTGPQLPPDPSLVAPALDPTGVTTFVDQTAFLYTGPSPIQTGVASGTITPVRSSVMRGRVLMRDGSPLPGATITIVGHPEFGQTLSRTDGMYDMAVNGGGLMTVNAAKTGFLPGQRTVDVRWRDYAVVDSMALVGIDPEVTAVDFASPIEVAQGGSVTDASGTRRATMMFEQGTTATMTLPNGTTQPLSTIHVRATEYSVGPNGPTAMPAALPPTSAYTYCVELSADEAIAAGATGVQFSKAVPFYVENFLGFPVGIHVPLGFYDRQRAAWASSPDGRVIKIVGVTSGVADVDATGDGVAESTASLDSLGLDTTERTQLATSYAVGQSLMRVETNHFSTADLNFYETNGQAPNGANAGPEDQPVPNPNCIHGSVIECDNQVLGEDIPLVGVPFSLHYRSYRAPGYTVARRIKVPLVGAIVPPGLVRINLIVDLAGRTFSYHFTPSANLSYVFEWDGKDAYGRELLGRQTAKLRIQNVYSGFYLAGPPVLASFGIPCAGAGCNSPLSVAGRTDFPITRTEYVGVGNVSMEAASLGGWSVDPHHVYDPAGQGTTYYGDGSRRLGGRINPTIVSLGISGGANFRIGPDGSIYVLRSEANFQDKKLRRIFPDGTSTVLINANFGYGGDGGPATAAGFNEPNDFDLAPDGSIYVADTDNGRLRRIGTDGIVTTVAGGNGFSCAGATSGIGTSLAFNGVYHVRCAPDGSVYFTSNCAYLYRLTPDGMVAAVAGTGTNGFAGNGVPATQGQIDSPSNIAVAPDGTVFLGLNSHVRRIGTNGIITTFAGNNTVNFTGNGIPATSEGMFNISGLAVGPDGTVYVSVPFYDRIRTIDAQGIIRTLAGNGLGNVSGDGGPAATAGLGGPSALQFDPEGRLVVNTSGGLRRIQTPMPGFSLTEYAVASEDGHFVDAFDAMGRHLRTLDAFTGARVFRFGYDASHHLSTITNLDGDVTTIQRDGAGNPTAIVGPDGATTVLGLDPDGFLNLVRNPAGNEYHFGYAGDGLLSSETHPRGRVQSFFYDAVGRLTEDNDQGGGFEHLSRVETPTSVSVTRTTAEGDAATYQVETLASGAVRRTTTEDGATSVSTTDLGEVTTSTTPDGMVATTTLVPDPRFGMTAPRFATVSLRTPAGLTQSITNTRNFTPGNNSVGLSVQEDHATTNGRTYLTRFEAGPRRITRQTPAGRVTIARLDSAGRELSIRVGGMDSLVCGYDSRGRLTSYRQGGRQWQLGYDSQGRINRATDPMSGVRQYEYDAADRITRQVLPDLREVLYTYDASGNLTSVTPPGRPAYSFDYSAIDLVDRYRPPTLGLPVSATVYHYDLDRRLTSVERPDGVSIGLTYAPNGEAATVTTPQGVIGLQFSPTTGRLSGMTTPQGQSVAYQYDGLLPIRETFSGTTSGSISVTYDNNFRANVQKINDADPISLTYDNDGLPTGAGALTLTRRPDNGLTSGTVLGSVTTSIGYSSAGDVVGLEARFAGSPLYSAVLGRDSLGRITGSTETVLGQTQALSYTYDPGGRLTDVFDGSTRIEHYDYDPNGNRTAFVGATAADTATALYDDQDRMLRYGSTRYLYSAAGDLTTKVEGADTTRYTYDAFGNLLAVRLPSGDLVEYVVDGFCRRVARKVNGVVTNRWLYQGALDPAAEVDSTGAVIARFVYCSRAHTPDYVIRGGVTYRVITNLRGDPRLVVDVSSGAVVEQFSHDAYGREIAATRAGVSPVGFASGLLDTLTGLVRFGARDYDPRTGRWTCSDPIGMSGGSEDVYTYCADDPINYSDPNGLKQELDQDCFILCTLDVILNIGLDNLPGGIGQVVSLIKEILGIDVNLFQSLGGYEQLVRRDPDAWAPALGTAGLEHGTDEYFKVAGGEDKLKRLEELASRRHPHSVKAKFKNLANFRKLKARQILAKGIPWIFIAYDLSKGLNECYDKCQIECP